jgi:PAS domain S-box
MKTEQERYRYIFDEVLSMSDDGFIVVDECGVVTDINEQYCEFLGKPKEEIVGFSIFKVIPNSKMLDIVTKRYSEELALHVYNPGKTKREDDNMVLVSRSCVTDECGEVVAGVAQVRFRLQAMSSAKRLVQEHAELEFYREEYHNANNNQFNFSSIVGSSEEIQKKKREGLRAAKTNFPILLTGETGTGKEVFAQAIHNASVRAGKPMVSINCAAIPSELLESELFGYTDGAFTGARKGGKKGKFQLADGGTLFLDEIGDMPLAMQAKILRVLQEQEVEPVGGTETVPVNVRIISATRQDLNRMTEVGAFREDLYYRLNVINIELTPLRERREDIPELSYYFLKRLNQEYKGAVTFSLDVLEALLEHPWRGNLRELDNVIKCAYATCDGLTIDISDLPSKFVPHVGMSSQGRKLYEVMDDYERMVIVQALMRNKGNCRKVADEFGIHRSALYKKLAKLGIETHKCAYEVENLSAAE